ncbi:MAG: MarR family transcriptional regulator, organic hydroperoxide resistance regulator [Patescibacteria group bacterium]|jgi:DNA-binding MarR family transcriptional regulator|nr:MarR family transcriptional regulator, organic hydroperoxide resistance regulator [Patescibacteria group bacterium]MDQ5912138.1 MarR family transcriptional regulator, organic hydroperoxide resistance regulator [Patescibacteria group bacterium]MDQ5954293.1 MarR family transcriptional regulator, organic hydroperoxide resistance regulator [Patescibacteria group bacterium]
MNVADIKLLTEFLSKALRVRRLLEQSSSFEDKALTLLQTQALKFIKTHPNTSVGSLVSELNMSFSSVTQLSNRLVDKGLVIRENNQTDRRMVTLSLTKKGEKQLIVFTKNMLSSNYMILASIPKADLKELVRIFTNILESQNKTK